MMSFNQETMPPRDRPNVNRVRRNLFGKDSSSSSSLSGDEEPMPLEGEEHLSDKWAEIVEDQCRVFRARWGFDVTTDQATPDGPFEWQQLSFDELPDAFKRMGGTRPRRYSCNSVSSSSEGSQSRSGSFSYNSYAPRKARSTFKCSEENGIHPQNVPSILKDSSSRTASERSLITDYLASQAKRTCANKTSTADSERHPLTLLRH